MINLLGYQLQRQSSNDSSGYGDGGDIDNNDIQGLLNDTDSELSSLSHLDAPDDVINVVYGVVIAMLLVGVIIVLVAVTIRHNKFVIENGHSACDSEANKRRNMVGSNGTLMTMRLVRSKLRKREESSSSVTVEAPTQIVPAVPEAPVTYRQNPSSVWVFPPLPPQPNLYCANSQDALVQANERNGLKGFKRQLSGRFKRLISRKPHEATPVIPPELKPQLKTIYVY
ncbi:uncharacterized protein LOC132257200 isoform X3 [Phlebotomus argentipes]|uniref:uncharacterized protein LOC132257200 isoform X3 n=1 Tax=Phlebotomus argentipes TaxID=94469 RepID=UPI002892A389|nr:uncharacterized protein LOC132257200 isoform X3 [Phlebotomus argentipes]XP_059609988.1 uncharacterized protein LOC132257200 isoform X3 [Phlebotomus argentipes]